MVCFRVRVARQTYHTTVMWLVFFICIIARVFAEQYASFLKLSENIDTRFGASILPIKPMSITSCFTICSAVKGCVYTSYHESSQLCGIHEINQPMVISRSWNIYFKRLDQTGKTAMDLKTGASASQSSTAYGRSADLALDGSSAKRTACTHTDGRDSYWIMQFGMHGVVDKVVIRMQPQIEFIARNTNMVLMVAQTYNDALNQVGIECGRYFGEPVNSYPYKLTIECETPIFGKFLRIQHETNQRMQMCEVFVYTP